MVDKDWFSERICVDNIMERLALEIPKNCEKCEGELEYLGMGQYKCKECGHEMLDNYGKIKKYYEEHGQAPIFQVARDTGISRENIHIILDRKENKQYQKMMDGNADKSNTKGRDQMHFLKNR